MPLYNPQSFIGGVESSFIEQNHITGSTALINNNSTILYVNPTEVLPNLNITLPAAPVNGQQVKVSFGGTLTSGSVVNVLTVQGSAGHTVLSASSITTANAGDGYIFKFQSSINTWRVF